MTFMPASGTPALSLLSATATHPSREPATRIQRQTPRPAPLFDPAAPPRPGSSSVSTSGGAGRPRSHGSGAAPLPPGPAQHARPAPPAPIPAPSSAASRPSPPRPGWDVTAAASRCCPVSRGLASPCRGRGRAPRCCWVTRPGMGILPHRQSCFGGSRGAVALSARVLLLG